MTAKKNIHVVKDGDDWKVRVEGNARASAVTGTQQASIARARELGKNNPGGAEVNIHGVDGKIRAKDTIKPANDPRERCARHAAESSPRALARIDTAQSLTDVPRVAASCASWSARATGTRTNTALRSPRQCRRLFWVPLDEAATPEVVSAFYDTTREARSDAWVVLTHMVRQWSALASPKPVASV